MSLEAEFCGLCQRCGSAYLAVSLRGRTATLPTCDCKEETLRNMLFAVLNVLERELEQPRLDLARQEIREFITEFDDE